MNCKLCPGQKQQFTANMKSNLPKHLQSCQQKWQKTTSDAQAQVYANSNQAAKVCFSANNKSSEEQACGYVHSSVPMFYVSTVISLLLQLFL